MVLAFGSDALFIDIRDNVWRWMLGMMSFPALTYTVLCFALPEIPRWLLGKHNYYSAISILKSGYPTLDNEQGPE